MERKCEHSHEFSPTVVIKWASALTFAIGLGMALRFSNSELENRYAVRQRQPLIGDEGVSAVNSTVLTTPAFQPVACFSANGQIHIRVKWRMLEAANASVVMALAADKTTPEPESPYVFSGMAVDNHYNNFIRNGTYCAWIKTTGGSVPIALDMRVDHEPALPVRNRVEIWLRDNFAWISAAVIVASLVSLFAYVQTTATSIKGT